MAAAPFRGLRREVAVALTDQKRTLYETAKALGRRSGDIQKVVRQMYDEGLLQSSDPKPVRGTEFWLDPRHRETLEDALRSDQPTGLLSQRQEILWLTPPDRTSLNEIISRADLTGAIAWAARLGRNGEMLLAIAPTSSDVEVERLTTALEAAAISVIGHQVTALLDGQAMRSVSIASAQTRDLLPSEIP